jgi:hypothetical protein
MQQQEQFNPFMGQYGETIQTLLGQFKKCGGRSPTYQEAVAALPEHARNNLSRAIHLDTQMQQQQMMQLQM